MFLVCFGPSRIVNATVMSSNLVCVWWPVLGRQLYAKDTWNQSEEHSRPCATASSFITKGLKNVTRTKELLPLFQRICALPHSDASLKNNFQSELSPYLLSLFEAAGMQKTRKSELYSILQDLWCRYIIKRQICDRWVFSFTLHAVNKREDF